MFSKHQASSHKKIESVDVDFNTLLKCRPPKYWVHIVYSDGTNEDLTATEKTIKEKYGPYLKQENSNNKSDGEDQVPRVLC